MSQNLINDHLLCHIHSKVMAEALLHEPGHPEMTSRFQMRRRLIWSSLSKVMLDSPNSSFER
ncbi:hypothetical protein C4K18_3068 [Pseudomonas chlororaphis subsp. aurantiaca]|nr:hypothetical protein C4K18_3068 [Pseudomonas chlororaphis subsp. aurantiaca]